MLRLFVVRVFVAADGQETLLIKTNDTCAVCNARINCACPMSLSLPLSWHLPQVHILVPVPVPVYILASAHVILYRNAFC